MSRGKEQILFNLITTNTIAANHFITTNICTLRKNLCEEINSNRIYYGETPFHKFHQIIYQWVKTLISDNEIYIEQQHVPGTFTVKLFTSYGKFLGGMPVIVLTIPENHLFDRETMKPTVSEMSLANIRFCFKSGVKYESTYALLQLPEILAKYRYYNRKVSEVRLFITATSKSSVESIAENIVKMYEDDFVFLNPLHNSVEEFLNYVCVRNMSVSKITKVHDLVIDSINYQDDDEDYDDEDDGSERELPWSYSKSFD